MPAEPDGRRRVMIEGVSPAVDCGRYPVKRTIGENCVVEAAVFVDGHDMLACVVRHRRGDGPWQESRMEFLGNDRWRGSFPVTAAGGHQYSVEAWVDRFGSWRRDLQARLAAGQDVSVDLQIGQRLVAQAAARASAEDARALKRWERKVGTSAEAALDDVLADLMDRHPERDRSASSPVFDLVADRERARFSAWYEMFPRSAWKMGSAISEGTLAGCEDRLAYIAKMGFDVLYLPPVHPIGRTHRKGKNNNPKGGRADPGSPWAIGSRQGGHTAVDPGLGTIEDFSRLVKRAGDFGLEVALDIAFQCSPDHPWVKAHPEWFRSRPDGTIQYAENPPKKYQDIYPLEFETDAWRELWDELRGVFEFWVDLGVKIFRVDNPHTKSFAFWEWVIAEVKAAHPEVIFLAEAFTRPSPMYRLAKLGFTQSYTYFAWRNHKQEIAEYMRELTTPPVSDFFRPNFWPNTPDILTENLQTGGRPAFISRLVLAATLASNYGIYGPAFELMESEPLHPGSEEYFGSEKYEVRTWDTGRPDSLAAFIAEVNRIRKENGALHANERLRFHQVGNDHLIAYSKSTPGFSNVILTVVNLDNYHTQSGWLDVDETEIGVEPGEPYQVSDLLTGARYVWQGRTNYVELNPHIVPAHIFAVQRHRRRDERHFEYFA